MELSVHGLKILKELEGFRAHKYDDNGKAPGGTWTIGFGHAILPHEHFIEPISEADATALLLCDVSDACSAVRDYVHVPLRDHQFDALSIFTFNVGRPHFAQSTLLKLLNLGQYEEVPRQLKRWTCSAGQYMPGLAKRRNAEINLWKGEL